MRGMLLVIAAALATVLAGCSKPTHVVFIAAEDEYHSEESLALLQQEARARGWETTLLTSQPDQTAAANIPGLEVLEDADLVVLFMRFRRLPAEQVGHLDAYLRRGGPVVGIRTSTHAFAYDAGDPLAHWNDFGAVVLGAPWIRHFGHDSSTDVKIASGASGSRLLKGVAPEFHVRSWLYDLEGRYPPSGSMVLLVGQSCDQNGRQVPERKPSPVAWTRTNTWGGKVFTTTLGHPEDFANPSVRVLLGNAMSWALGGTGAE